MKAIKEVMLAISKNTEMMNNIIKNRAKIFEQFKQEVSEKTDLNCSCGENLYKMKSKYDSFDMAKMIAGNPRYSKKARLRKKFAKQYDIKFRKCYSMILMTSYLRQPLGYACIKCGKRYSFYNAIASNMIKIEPLPEGAELIY